MYMEARRGECLIEKAIIMTTREEIIDYINRVSFQPALASHRILIASKRRIWCDLNRFTRLPARSIARYVQHGAQNEQPNRRAANEELEGSGFLIYRQLLPLLKERFPELWD